MSVESDQSTRCPDEPRVNDSGTTYPWVCFFRRPFPIAVAALSASATSPESSYNIGRSEMYGD